MKHIFIAALLLIFSPSVQYAVACDCHPPSSANDMLMSSTLVFSGDLLDKTKISLSAISPDYEEYVLTFRVKRYWKGLPKRTVKIRTPVSEDDCGVPYVTGKSYLVYAAGGDNLPLVTLCGRTASLEATQATQDMERLGVGKVPEI